MTRTLLALFLSLGSLTSFGQKTAHINTLELIDNMPEKAQAQEELNILRIETESLLKELVDKYARLALEIEEKGETWSAVILQMKKNELIRMEQTIQDAKAVADNNFAIMEQELLDPILEKAMQAIQVVADKRGYEYVIDTATGSALITPEEHNLLSDVLEELGLGS